MSAPLTISLRPPAEVMRLSRMGSMFQTRLSFMRVLLRRMAREGWQISRPIFDLDKDGFGTAVYQINIGARTYSLIAFTQDLDPEARTDRVIAEAWDATFSFFDGIPSTADIDRLRGETPRQEAGRFLPSELTLSRANKSLRLFRHVVASLAAGQQPDLDMIRDIGYLMRTTAVYGSGKFGCADRGKISERPEFQTAFQAELLTVYLIRLFTFDVVDHVAQAQGGDQAARLDPDLKRFLGIGNATGLGMAPFLINHQTLLHNWVLARETALARVRSRETVEANDIAVLRQQALKAQRAILEWQVEDAVQLARIEVLRQEMPGIITHLSNDAVFAEARPLDQIYRWAAERFSLEAQELVVSLLLEPFADLVDDLSAWLHIDEVPVWDPAMTLGSLRQVIADHYSWLSEIDFNEGPAQSKFWYYSQEKFEPRMGARHEEPGMDLEMPLAVARDVALLRLAIDATDETETVASFVRRHPNHRHTITRVQTAARYPYGEIADNVIEETFRPIDMLRFKLAYFGASRFDPKSDLWTRITLFQGAPLPEDLSTGDGDNWSFAVAPSSVGSGAQA